MRGTITLGVLMVCVAAPAFADSIRWKPETLTPGEYTSIDQSQGGLIHHVYRGPAPSGTPVFTTYLDKDGNQLRWVRQDGFELTFHPHDCTRSVGRCQYTQKGSDGRTEHRLRVTEVVRNGFRFTEYGADGQHLFGGRLTLDARGNAGNGRLDGTAGSQRFRLVRRVYQ